MPLDPRWGEFRPPSLPVPTLPPNPDYTPLPVADASDVVFHRTGVGVIISPGRTDVDFYFQSGPCRSTTASVYSGIPKSLS